MIKFYENKYHIFISVQVHFFIIGSTEYFSGFLSFLFSVTSFAPPPTPFPSN